MRKTQRLLRYIPAKDPRYQHDGEGGYNPFYEVVTSSCKVTSLCLDSKRMFILRGDGELVIGVKQKYNAFVPWVEVNSFAGTLLNGKTYAGHFTLTIPKDELSRDRNTENADKAVYAGWLARRESYFEVFLHSGRFPRHDLDESQRDELERHLTMLIQSIYGLKPVHFIDYYKGKRMFSAFCNNLLLVNYLAHLVLCKELDISKVSSGYRAFGVTEEAWIESRIRVINRILEVFVFYWKDSKKADYCSRMEGLSFSMSQETTYIKHKDLDQWKSFLKFVMALLKFYVETGVDELKKAVASGRQEAIRKAKWSIEKTNPDASFKMTELVTALEGCEHLIFDKTILRRLRLELRPVAYEFNEIHKITHSNSILFEKYFSIPKPIQLNCESDVINACIRVIRILYDFICSLIQEFDSKNVDPQYVAENNGLKFIEACHHILEHLLNMVMGYENDFTVAGLALGLLEGKVKSYQVNRAIKNLTNRQIHNQLLKHNLFTDARDRKTSFRKACEFGRSNYRKFQEPRLMKLFLG